MTRLSGHRFVAIDGLRGIAALYVVVFHCNWQTHVATTTFVENGYLAVDLFFILSGFVIANAYGARISGAFDFSQFMIRRLFRLYPLHLAILLAFLALECARALWIGAGNSTSGPPVFAGERDMALFAAHLFMLQGLGLTRDIGWNAPSWSISCEIAAYIAFALLVIPLAGHRLLRRLPLLLPLTVLLAAALLYLPLSQGLFGQFTGLVRCIAGFSMGAALTGLIRLPAWNTNISRISGFAWGVIEVGLSAAVVLALALIKGPVAYLAVPLFAVAVLVLQADRGPVAQLLSGNSYQFLGRVSYSIYMVHILVIIGFTFALKRIEGAADFIRLDDGRPMMLANAYLGDAMLVVMLIAVAVVSDMTYRWIEEPGRMFGRRIADHLQGAPKRDLPLSTG